MREIQSRLYKYKGKYDWSYLWLVEHTVNQWEIIHNSSGYQLYTSIGNRGAAVENGELLVEDLSKHTFEGYIEFCEEKINSAKPLAMSANEFLFTVNIDFDEKEDTYLNKKLKKLLSEYTFVIQSETSFQCVNAPTDLLKADGVTENSIYVQPKVETSIQLVEIVEELLIPGINFGHKSQKVQQLSIF